MTKQVVCEILLLVFVLAVGHVPAYCAELFRTGQSSCYDQEGSIIEHAGTGQDGDLQSGVVWPEPRFSDNGNGTITDNLTGFDWLKDGGCLAVMTWQAAMDLAADFNLRAASFQCAGLTEPGAGWRLPEIRDLETLINAEEVHGNHWLNGRGFRKMGSGSYWSATLAPDSYSAWSFDIAGGEVVKSAKVNSLKVLLVRRPALPVEMEMDTELTSPDVLHRFVDNGDGTVTDNRTGLMWIKDANCFAAADWSGALGNIKKLNSGQKACKDLAVSFVDWALPNRHELRSLIDHQSDLPALPENPFLDLQPLYWTSTTVAGHPELAFDLHLGSGDLQGGEKKLLRSTWPVRPVSGREVRQRKPDKTEAPVVKAENYRLRPVGETLPLSWPVKRFTDHGDGTVTDNITGIMWLKDADCFGKRQWYYADFYLEQLNKLSDRVSCRDYSGSYDDWRLPDHEILQELITAAEGEPAAWLNEQGVVGAKARDYWTTSDNSLNLYYAWAMNLKQGTSRNYSKGFRLYLWPCRFQVPSAVLESEPMIMGNGRRDTLHLARGEALRLTVGMKKVGGPVPALYYIWYDSPDGSSWWLSSDGKWLDRETVFYEGNIFAQDETEIYHADTTELADGDYIFYFTVQPMAVDEMSTAPVFSSTLYLSLEDSGTVFSEH